MTKLVHGEEEATKAQESARALFSSGAAANIPTAELLLRSEEHTSMVMSYSGQAKLHQTVFFPFSFLQSSKAQESARALFSSGAAANMPTAELTEEDLVDGSIDILTMLVKSGLVPSKSEARRAVDQGGVAVDGDKVTDIKAVFAKDVFAGEGIVLRRGKKNFRKVIMK